MDKQRLSTYNKIEKFCRADESYIPRMSTGYYSYTFTFANEVHINVQPDMEGAWRASLIIAVKTIREGSIRTTICNIVGVDNEEILTFCMRVKEYAELPEKDRSSLAAMHISDGEFTTALLSDISLRVWLDKKIKEEKEQYLKRLEEKKNSVVKTLKEYNLTGLISMFINSTPVSIESLDFLIEQIKMKYPPELIKLLINGFSPSQMKEIIDGYSLHLDIRQYTNPSLGSGSMRAIKNHLVSEAVRKIPGAENMADYRAVCNYIKTYSNLTPEDMCVDSTERLLICIPARGRAVAGYDNVGNITFDQTTYIRTLEDIL